MITPSIDHWCCWLQAVTGPLATSFTFFSATLNLDSSTLTWGDARAQHSRLAKASSSHQVYALDLEGIFILSEFRKEPAELAAAFANKDGIIW